MAESSIGTSAIFSARPALRLAGREEPRLDTLMTALRMDEQEGGLSSLELRLSNWIATPEGRGEPAFDASSPLKLGAELQVGSGDASQPIEIFRGKVSALEIVCQYGQPPELVVLAEDALTAARRGRRTRVYADTTPAGVVQAVAAELGLTPHVQGLAAPVGTWVQLNETDLGFLRRLLTRFDADLQTSGTDLTAAPRQDVQRGTVELLLNSQLARVRITADLADQVTAVTVAGWNDSAGSAVKGEATQLGHAGPGSGRDGISWAGEVFGSRSEHLGRSAVTSDDEARAVAEAALDRRARRFVRAEGVAEGNPRLRVGTQVRIAGVSAQFDNTYTVTRATHLFDQRQGYRVEFGAECAFLAG